MTLRLRLLTALAVAVSASLVSSLAVAQAAPPTVTSVSPMRTKVGQVLTVNGRNFNPRVENTVIFMSDYGPTVFVHTNDVRPTRLTVRLPRALEQGMRGYPSNPRTNRFQLRVLSAEQMRGFTPRSRSPLISPGAPPPPPDTDRDGVPDTRDDDDDGDFLLDTVERSVRTNPLKKDTDGDGREDGWEYYAAKDLNHQAVPYPGRRPFPNPLDPSPADGAIDFDGDILRSSEEHALWVYNGRRFDRDKLSNGEEDSALWYSDGTQTSTPTQAPYTPAFQRYAPRYANYPVYDAEWEQPTYPDFLSRDGDNVWSDDERDADRDGLSNSQEEHMEMSKRVWDGWLNGKVCDGDGRSRPSVTPWRENDGAYYGAYDLRPFAEPTMMDPDLDGDGLLDGEDDQDNDDVPNYSELDFKCQDGLLTYDDEGEPVDTDGDEVPEGDPDGTPNVNPYNPCAPYGSWHYPDVEAGTNSGWPNIMARTCPRYKPFE